MNTDLIDALRRLLASTFTVYLHTHGMHWNVTGPRFPELHAMFGDLYEELHAAVDEIAERIRHLGGHAPASYAAFSALTSVQVDLGEVFESEDVMLERLRGMNMALVADARALAVAASAASDQASVDLGARRQLAAEKAVWMLSSSM